MYIHIKKIEDTLLPWIIRASTLNLSAQDAARKHALNDAILSAITSSKYLKDIQHHIIYLKDDSVTSNFAAKSLHTFQDMIQKTCTIIQDIDWKASVESRKEMLQTYIQTMHLANDEFLQSLGSELSTNDLSTLHIAEVIKTNRYVLLSCEELVL